MKEPLGKEALPMSKEWTPVIAIHGGAGIILKEKMSANLEDDYRDTLKASLEAGFISITLHTTMEQMCIATRRW